MGRSACNVIQFSKCGYLITHSPLKAPAAIWPSLQLNGELIPVVRSYKNLGVMFPTFGIDFQVQGKMLAQKVDRHLAAMRWFSTRWSPRIRLNLMKSILLFTLEYSLLLIYHQFVRNHNTSGWKILSTAYNNCLKWIAGRNADQLHLTSHLLGLLPFKDRAQYLYSRFYLHIIAMDDANPLHSILKAKEWYPKFYHHIQVHIYYPLLYQFRILLLLLFSIYNVFNNIQLLLFVTTCWKN